MELLQTEKSRESARAIRPELVVILALACLTLATFWPVRNFDFINYDDDIYIVKNPHLADGLSWKGIRWALTADLTHPSPFVDYWQPVTLFSRMLDVQLFGMDPAGHHRMNLILHCLNVLILFMLLNDWTGALGRSAMVSALFAIHPLQVEPVAWVTARKDLLSCFFGLLALRAYKTSFEAPSSGSRISSPLLFGLACMSKPVWVTFPFLLMALDYWPLQRISQSGDWIKRLKEKRALFLLSAVFLFIPFIGQPKALSYASPLVVAANIPTRFVSYLAKFLFPLNLTLEGALIDTGLHFWRFWGAGIFLIGVTALTLKQAKRRPYLSVGWFWFLILLAPAIGSPWFDSRFMYPSLVGLALMGVWGVTEIAARWRYSKPVLGFLGAIPLSVGIFLTSSQVQNWKDSLSLFQHAVEVNPNNYKAHHQLCSAWIDRGDFDQARAHCLRAIQIKPDLVRSYYNLGFAAAKQEKAEEAIRYYRKALRIDPQYLEAHSNLGVLLASREAFDLAAHHFREALRLDPQSAETHNNLGLVLSRQEKWDEALIHLKEALRLDPKADYIRQNINLIESRRESSH